MGKESEKSFIVVVQSQGHVPLFVTSLTLACQAPLSSIISWSWLIFVFIGSVMLYNHLILCHPLYLVAFNLSQHQSIFQ